MEFSQKDLFWKSNILSPKKLREKYDTLWLQKDRPKPQPGTPTKAAPQKGNFTQRKYTDEEIEKLYSVCSAENKKKDVEVKRGEKTMKANKKTLMAVKAFFRE